VTKPTPPSPARVLELVALIPEGRANARTALQLAILLGLPGTESGKRAVRALVAGAVEANYLVCGDDAGHFFPLTAAEAEPTRLRAEAQMAASRERLRKFHKLIAAKFPSTQLPLI